MRWKHTAALLILGAMIPVLIVARVSWNPGSLTDYR
jgi:hypothetical protein